MADESTKKCYGKSWSATHPACAGGADPMWTNDDGTHTRPKCDYFAACGARKMAEAQEQRLIQIRTTTPAPQQQQYAPQQPVMPQAPRAVSPYVPQYPQAPQPSYAPQYPPPQAYQPPAYPQQQPFMQPMQMMVQAPMQVPMQQMMPVNFAMPGYLSAPEPYTGNNYMSMLGMSILRAMCKAAGHTVANVLDTVPFGTVPPPK